MTDRTILKNLARCGRKAEKLQFHFGRIKAIFGTLVIATLVNFMILVDPIIALTSTPVDAIEDFHAELLSVMKAADDLAFAGRQDRLKDYVEKLYDSRFMSRAASGSKWSGFSEDQKEKLAETFRAFTLANYASRFDGYSGQRFITTGTRDVRGGRVFVRTELIKTDGEAIRIDYLMRERGGRWWIIDVFLDGTLSEVALRRSEFTPILRDQGFDGLITMLRNKIADLAGVAE